MASPNFKKVMESLVEEVIQKLDEEVKAYNSWVRPNDKDLELEYKIEYEIKPLKAMTNNAFPTVESFKKAAKAAKVIKLTPNVDSKIAYRSRTRTKEQILNLIRGYASYPQFRNEKTIDNIYKAFEENKPMTMPIVLKMPDGSMRIMGGNTRADIAAQLGITPQAILVEVPRG
jgi:hypothetical protein